jgi:hypothetical protein
MPQLCVLCGEREATKGDGDHIPPQSLYPKPRIANFELHKVPACAECNNTAGVEDEEFKLIVGISTGEYRENQAEIIESMGRTIRHNRRLARQLFAQSQRTFADRGRGVLEPVVAVGFNGENYVKVIRRMIRGLFWRETGTIMAIDTEVVVFSAVNMNANLAKELQELMSYLTPRKLNGGTFIYKVHLEENGSSVWGMQFFGKHKAFAYTKPHEHNEPPQSTC